MVVRIYGGAHIQWDSIRPSVKQNEILPWMDLEGTMLSEVSQRQIPYDFTYVWNLKNKMNKRN